MLEFQVLGPFGVFLDGRQVDLPAAMHRRLAAILSCNIDRPMSLEALADSLWQGSPPASARRTLLVYIHRLRRVFGDEHISRGPTGYRLAPHGVSLDSHRFTALTSEALTARDRGEAQLASSLFGQALALWRGEAYADLDKCHDVDEAAARLTEQYLRAVKQYAQLELDQGRHADLLALLASVAALHPYDEHLHGQLMLALYRSGRQSDALARFHDLRDRLRDELGIYPGAELAGLNQQILRMDTSLLPAQQVAATIPSSLPRDIPGFIGRTEDLSELDRLAEATTGKSAAILVTTVTGSPGIGKTALCIHWAHRRQSLYPDGQLYLNLHGFDREHPLKPVDALGQLLRELGLPAERVPQREEEASAAYRTALAGKRILVLLDNAATVDQVRPLLPASMGSIALITSRNRLAGLVARDDARRLALGLLTPQDATDLLTAVLSPTRTEPEPIALAALAKLCGYLPLALRIAAADLADQPNLTVAEYAEKLQAGNPVDALEFEDDPESAVRVVFEQSYKTLTSSQQQGFRLLGLFPGTHYSAAAMEALWGLEKTEAAAILGALCDAHLIEEPRAGRYEMHDLLRRFAELRAACDPALNDAALQRLFTHFQQKAEIANAAISSSAGSAIDGMTWMEDERANLIEAISIAISNGWAQTGCDLAQTLWRFFHFAGHTSDWINTFERVLAMAKTVADQATTSFVMNSLGGGYLKAGRYDEAVAVLAECVALRTELGDLAGLARSYANLAQTYEYQGQYDLVLTATNTAMEMARSAGDRVFEMQLASGALVTVLERTGQYVQAEDILLRYMPDIREYGTQHDVSRMLSNLAHMQRMQGKTDLALAGGQEALALSRKIGNRHGEANSLWKVGCIYRDLGDTDQALALLHQGIELLRQVGMPAEECEALNELAATFTQIGDTERALESYVESLALARQIGAAGLQAHSLLAISQLEGKLTPGERVEHLHAALAILDDINPVEAARVRESIRM